MKRYYLEYESDEVTCRSHNHTWGYANSVKTCKQYIKRCKEQFAERHPHNFRIYDSQSVGEYAGVVYQED